METLIESIEEKEQRYKRQKIYQINKSSLLMLHKTY